MVLSGVRMHGVPCGDLVMVAPPIDGHSGKLVEPELGVRRW